MTEKSRVILLVEGDIVIRHPLADYLRECGFTVIEAASVEEAKDLLSAPDVKIEIVLTNMSTIGGGFALKQWVRQQRLGIDVILAGTVEKAVDHASKLCNGGPAVRKPYDHKLILDRIRQAVARRNRNEKTRATGS